MLGIMQGKSWRSPGRYLYISVEPFYLFRYLDEQAFGYNHRKMSDTERFDVLVRHIAGKRLTLESAYRQDRGRVSTQSDLISKGAVSHLRSNQKWNHRTGAFVAA
jgi:hypothetical protein